MIFNKETQDQILAIMLLHGNANQQKEAVEEILVKKDQMKTLSVNKVNPEIIMNLKNDDTFTWDGKDFIFNVFGEYHGGVDSHDKRVFLTAIKEDFYGNYVHLRTENGALFTRKGLIESLKSEKYEIS